MVSLEQVDENLESNTIQYTLLDVIGKGSFGMVARCIRKFDRQPFAMKILSKSKLRKNRKKLRNGSGDASVVDGIQRVYKEIELMKSISHTNILKVEEFIDDGESDQIMIISEISDIGPVMRFDNISKRYLFMDINGPGVVREETIKYLYSDLMRGIIFLHSLGISHRDIKPENLLLFHTNSSGRLCLKIADFGCSISFDWDPTLNRFNDVVSDSSGTPAFWAPESIVLLGDSQPSNIQNKPSEDVTRVSSMASSLDSDLGLCLDVDHYRTDERGEREESSLPKSHENTHELVLSDQLQHVEGYYEDKNPPMEWNGISDDGDYSSGSVAYSAFTAEYWAVGVTLFCFLFGCLPFLPAGDDDYTGLFFEIKTSPPRCCLSNTSDHVTVSSQALEIVHMLLSKTPSNRKAAWEQIKNHEWLLSSGD